MDDFPLKINDWINGFVAHNWIAAAVVLSVLGGLAEKYGWAKFIYDLFRNAWKVVRPPSNESTKKG